MKKRMSPLFHSGQFLGSPGSSSEKSTSNPGAMLPATDTPVTCLLRSASLILDDFGERASIFSPGSLYASLAILPMEPLDIDEVDELRREAVFISLVGEFMDWPSLSDIEDGCISFIIF